MNTSARNQFTGQVKSIQQGAVNDEITLEIPGGHSIVSVITCGSTQNLGLTVGSDAFALVKASSLIVVAGDSNGAIFSARNRLQGHVLELTEGAVNSELIIGLTGGVKVVAIITNDSCKALALGVGKKAGVIFKASCVILGVPG